jgi:NitT/TauT family transport system permease protein
VVGFLLLWQIVAWMRLVSPLVLSSPIDIAVAAVQMIQSGVLGKALLSTVQLFAVGFGISLLIGLVVGAILGWFRRIEAVVDPLVSVLYATPRLALIPLVVVWCGPGFTSQVVIVVLLAAFPILINVASGVSAVDSGQLRLARSFLATNRDMLLTVALPAALPAVISGIRQGLNLALSGVVVAEYFVGTTGVGGLIFLAGSSLNTSQAFVGALVFAFAALVLTQLLKLIENRLGAWRVSA